MPLLGKSKFSSGMFSDLYLILEIRDQALELPVIFCMNSNEPSCLRMVLLILFSESDGSISKRATWLSSGRLEQLEKISHASVLTIILE
jgi:hypothetical protein